MDIEERPVWVTPLPPLASGIAQYSDDFLQAIQHCWALDVLPEAGSSVQTGAGSCLAFVGDAGSRNRRILQIGNSRFHGRGFKLAEVPGAIVVLHDIVLHHARLADFVARRHGRAYIELMRRLYGDDGEGAARAILRGHQIDTNQFPLSEDIVGRAGLVIVHSSYAREQVMQLSPGADVVVVPMGVPLPSLVDRYVARSYFDLPLDAFVLVSITHVNPMKRIPVVLRAFRRLIERQPASRFIIAGSVANLPELERQIQLLGLRQHVQILGYLSDDEARVLTCASDVAVNLRYPSTGETSASLLRLMGAGRAVIVTDHGSFREIPEGAVLHLPIDRLEEETLAEYLAWLASDASAREEIGAAARRFVELQHSMGVAVDGYRAALRSAWGIDYPGLSPAVVCEPPPVVADWSRRSSKDDQPVPEVIGGIADRLHRLGLSGHDGTIQSVARAAHRLGLEETMSKDDRSVDPALLEILACPACKTPVRLDDRQLVCDSCGRSFEIKNGIPVMLLSDGARN